MMKTPVNVDIEKHITLNQNMLRYAEIELQNQAYLDCLCVIDQILKSLENLPVHIHDEFRICILRIKAERKKA